MIMRKYSAFGVQADGRRAYVGQVFEFSDRASGLSPDGLFTIEGRTAEDIGRRLANRPRYSVRQGHYVGRDALWSIGSSDFVTMDNGAPVWVDMGTGRWWWSAGEAELLAARLRRSDWTVVVARLEPYPDVVLTLRATLTLRTEYPTIPSWQD